MKKLLPFLGSLFLLYSCSTDNDIIKKSGDYKLRHMTSREFQSHGKAFNAFTKTTRAAQTSANGKIVYNGQYGITYDTDKITYIEKDGYESYTIPIIKTQSDSLIKNLVLYKKPNDNFKIRMMAYKLDDQDIKNMQAGEPFDVYGKTYSFRPIQTDDVITASWFDDSGCLTTATIIIIPGHMCAQNLHGCGEACLLEGDQAPKCPEYIVHFDYAFCDSGTNPAGPIDIGAPPGSPQGGTPGMGGTGNPPTGNNGDDDDVVTTPVVPGLDGNQDETPCEQLGDLLNTQKYDLQSSVNYVMNYVNSPTNDHEISVTLSYQYNNATDSYSYVHDIQNQSQNGGEVPDAPGKFGIMHIHTKNGIPIFSFQDLVTLRNLYYNATQSKKNKVIMLLLTKNYTTGKTNAFALKVDNYDILDNLINTMLSAQYPTLTDDDKIKAVDNKQRSFLSSHLSDIENAFLVQYGSAGFSLYKSGDMVNSTQISNWAKIKLNDNPTPCN